MEELHKPVMLDEVVRMLDPKPGENYLDLTAGYAGHASKILATVRDYKHSILVDRDEFAIEQLSAKYPMGEVVDLNSGEELPAREELLIVKTDFYNAAQSIIECGKTFDMVLADFGVSSPQIDNADRGFSFSHPGPLDMRMDRSQELSADTIVNHWRPKDLEEIFMKYGEESAGLAKKHARAMTENRPITDTLELAEVIAGGKRSKHHPATQVFQAIRIAVNDELSIIERTLPLLPKLLKPGGRVAIITFHSLEDRLVKDYFRKASSLGEESELYVLTKSPITAGKLELVINPRARSAKLRVAKRV